MNQVIYFVDYQLGEKMFSYATNSTPYNDALRFQEQLAEDGIMSTMTKMVHDEEHHVRTTCLLTEHGIDTIIYL